MEREEKKLRIMDGLVVYMICLILFGVLGMLIIAALGLYGILLCEILVLLVVLIAAKMTNLKRKTWIRLEKPTGKQSAGAAFLFAAGLLIVLPLVLYAQLLVPNFAVSSFRINDQMGASQIWPLVLIIFLAPVSETLLFEGYMYSRFRYLDSFPLLAAGVSILYGIYHMDLYILLPEIILEIVILKVRRSTSSLILPYTLHVFTALVAMMLMQSAKYSEALLGASMGGVQVTGLALIFASGALTMTMVGLSLLGDGKKMPIKWKIIWLAGAVVLFAVGSGIASLGK